MDQLIAALGEEVLDPDEEVFSLFSQTVPSQNLGFVDPKAETLDLFINDKEYSIKQSPAVLNSNRAGGSAGAVVWKVTPYLACWVCSPTCILRTSGILGADATAVELGTGISGLVALSLSPNIARYIATDQPYTLKLLRQNLIDNAAVAAGETKKQSGRKRAGQAKAMDVGYTNGRVVTTSLDWETDSALSLRPCMDAAEPKVDVVIACDCIYNEALVESFVSTCADICGHFQPSPEKPTIVLVAQQLRAAEVFEAWLNEMMKVFRIWRIPDQLLTSELSEGKGFAVHVGVLRAN